MTLCIFLVLSLLSTERMGFLCQHMLPGAMGMQIPLNSTIFWRKKQRANLLSGALAEGQNDYKNIPLKTRPI